MYLFFKRTKIEPWEIEILRSPLQKLPHQYSSLLDQFDDGLLKGVLFGMSDIPGLITFTYHPYKIKKHEKDISSDCKIVNIKVYDIKKMKFLSLEIYVLSGCISGYTLEGVKTPKIDMAKTDTTNFKKMYLGNEGFNTISHLLIEEEKQLIQPSEVYSIILSGKEYFLIADIEAGDFIGIDSKNNLYKVTHDPFEIILLNRDTLGKWIKN
jgi:hypothetical protein